MKLFASSLTPSKPEAECPSSSSSSPFLHSPRFSHSINCFFHFASQCPHMLFYGPPGTGKTTTALAIAHQLFGPELYKSRVLELNASDDRELMLFVLRLKLSLVAVGTNHRKNGYPCPPFKIIVLDEADSMTEDAQDYRTTCFKMCKIQVQAIVRRYYEQPNFVYLQ